MKQLSSTMKIFLSALIVLVIVAAALTLLVLNGRSHARYETVDSSYQPVEAGDMPQAAEDLTVETIAPAEETEEAEEAESADEADSEEAETETAESTETTETASETETESEAETEAEEESTVDADGFTLCQDTVSITGNSVNIRSQPNTNCEVLGTANAGQSYSRSGYNADNWFRIDYNGQTAYVSGDYAEPAA